MNAQQTYVQIRALTIKMVELGLCDDQQFPTFDDLGAIKKISIPGTPNFSIAMRNISYREIYDELSKSRSYNFRMIDGALIQIQYTFEKDSIDSHRLSFFPAPDLEAFQNEPEIYIEDEIYADFLQKNTVTFPIRFDFNICDKLHVDINHPKSHLTLGQYKNCRIPVNCPVAPATFIKFILQHFYNSAYCLYAEKIEPSDVGYDICISDNERRTPHISMEK